MNETVVILKDDDINITMLTFIAESSYDRYDSFDVLSVDWYIDGVFYESGFVSYYTVSEIKVYEIKADFKINGIVFFSDIKRIDLISDFEQNLDFSISKRYGPPPLSIRIEDITDYSNLGFVPKIWTWCISGTSGCSAFRRMGIKYRTFVFANEGIYSIRMTVSDGNRSYSVLKKDVIFVQRIADGMQIEFAEQTGENNRRHLIKSSHSEDDDSKNKIEFLIWGSEISEGDIPTNKILEINKEYGILTKNTFPFISNNYDIGSIVDIWRNVFLSNLNILDTTQSKILNLWSGK